jgi:hypothetical protein
MVCLINTPNKLKGQPGVGPYTGVRGSFMGNKKGDEVANPHPHGIM